jgi:hypothetical protein
MKNLTTLIAAFIFTATVNAQNAPSIAKGIEINKGANGASVNWTASNQKDISQFELEISYDNCSFSTIRTVIATEKTYCSASYEAKFRRTYLSVEKIYYRVKTVFADCSTEVTPSIALEIKSANGVSYASIH